MTYSDFTRRVERKLKRIRRIRRKQQLRTMAIMLVLLLMIGSILYLLGAYVARPWLDKLDKAEASTVMSTTTATVGPGDTLWHIARDKYPDMDPRRMVYEIRKLNPEVDPGRLQIGQEILVPEIAPSSECLKVN